LRVEKVYVLGEKALFENRKSKKMGSGERQVLGTKMAKEKKHV
jgi:hypothetical protein